MTARLLSAAELAAIGERVAAATPGPWRWKPGAPSEWWQTRVQVGDLGIEYNTAHDAAFVAHSRTDVPTLLAHVAAVTGERNLLAENLRNCATNYSNARKEADAAASERNTALAEARRLRDEVARLGARMSTSTCDACGGTGVVRGTGGGHGG